MWCTIDLAQIKLNLRRERKNTWTYDIYIFAINAKHLLWKFKYLF